MSCGIYLITGLANPPTNLGDNGYFGLSTNIELRSGQHFSALRNGTHTNRHLQNYTNKYGIENLQMKIILECEPEALSVYEKEYIADANTYGNPRGFNFTPGGDGVGDANAQPYHFRNIESGEEVAGENLHEFCRNRHGLNRDCMYRVKNGKQKLHKNWYCPNHCTDEQARDLREPYSRIDIEGQSPETNPPEPI